MRTDGAYAFACSTLVGIQEQMRPTLDISVQFFGIDWNHLFRISDNFLQLTEEIIAIFKDSTDINCEVDVLLPRCGLPTLTPNEIPSYPLCLHSKSIFPPATAIFSETWPRSRPTCVLTPRPSFVDDSVNRTSTTCTSMNVGM